AVAIEQSVWHHDECPCTAIDDGCEGALEIVGGTHLQDVQLYPQSLRCGLGLRHEGGRGGIGRVPEDGDASDLGHGLFKDLQFPLISTPGPASPVILPPGRATLPTNPWATASVYVVMTIGIVLVACCAARIAALPAAIRTWIGSRTSSVARSGSRST